MDTDCGEELERLRHQQASLLETMDHALRTPMQSLKGIAGRLDPEMPAALLEHGVNSLKRSAAQVVDVWEDLWLRHKLEGGTLMLLPTEIDVEALLAELARVFESFFPDCLVEWEYANAIPPVHADRYRTFQILWTLLRNANRCRVEAQQAGLLAVLVHHNRGMQSVVFQVAGEGLQIPAGDLVRVFEEFSDVATGPSPTGAGFGLGLYVARALARQMGGDLAVLTEPSGSGPQYGPAFALTLPAFEGHNLHV